MAEDNNTEIKMIAVPPPTQQPSDAILLLSLIHLICLTSTLCGNISQIVLQLYSHRIRRKSHVQQFLVLFFLVNAIVSLGTPWLIVETLVRHWTFGPLACRAYQGTSQIGRLLLPYIIVALYVITFQRMSISNKFRFCQSMTTILFLLIFGVLVLFIIIPYIGSAKIVYHYLSEPLIINYSSLVFRTQYCVGQFSKLVYTKDTALIVEVLVPILICAVCAIRLKCTTQEETMSIEPIPTGAVNKYLLIIASIHFLSGIWYYFPLSHRETILHVIPEKFTSDDIKALLPHIATSISWVPAANLSAIWDVYESRENLLSPQSLSRSSRARTSRSVVPQGTTTPAEETSQCANLPLIPRSPNVELLKP